MTYTARVERCAPATREEVGGTSPQAGRGVAVAAEFTHSALQQQSMYFLDSRELVPLSQTTERT